MITLYGHSYSRAHRVLWMLKELDLPFVHTPTEFRDGSTHKADYLAVNPNGRVPALIDEGQPFFESLAINLYLARKYGSEIAPQSFIEEGLATQWSLWAATEVEKPLLLASANLLLFAPESRDPAELAVMLKKLDRPFKVIDAHLAGQRYLLGERFTVADLNVAALMTLIPICGVPIGAYPHFAEWLSRCIERPAAADWKPIKFQVPRPEGLGMLAMFV